LIKFITSHRKHCEFKSGDAAQLGERFFIEWCDDRRGTKFFTQRCTYVTVSLKKLY